MSKYNKLWKDILLRNIFFATLVVIFLLILSSVFLDIFTRHGKSSPVPDFTGKYLDSVLIIAAKNNLRIEVIDSVFRIDMPRGSVLLQNPESGTRVKKNRKIFLTMNSFSPRKESLPDVRDISLRQAKTELNAKEFRVGKLEYSHKHPYTNNVFQQMYRGKSIEPGVLLPVGEYIDLKLGLDSISHTTFNVPDVTGLKKQAVEDVIIENSLNYILIFDRKGVKTVTDSLNCVAYEQEPAAGSIAYYGNKVKVKLKLPPKSTK
ncbi:MAG: PASTA domain-containing protein [Prevotellaceae bacterium]|jgi:beta-lactam-binding protein with PASTA domain|nr:PASTA domain-containing protein [Prevotellaceae bacterium]